MVRYLGMIIAFLLMMESAGAQENYLDMRLGAGIATGDFAASGADSVGFAGNGFTMAFEANYFFLDHMGVVGGLTYGMNFLDDVALQDYLTQRLQELFPGVVLPEETVTQFTSQQWNNVNLLVGPVITLPVAALRFEVRGLTGISFVMPPAWDLYLSWEDKQFHATSAGQSARFAWMAGAGMLYRNEAGYGLRLGVDYLHTSTRFDVNYRYEEGGAGESPYHAIPQYLPVTMFQATVGIMYAF